jgi:hypothetical protein
MQENPKKQKKCFSKKIAFCLFFSMLFFFSFSRVNKAYAWDATAANEILFAQTEISYAIKGMMMGALKQAAIKMLSKQMDRFISGVSGNGARFITNWEDYLINNPARNTQRYANDYISRALSGRGSVSYKKKRNSVFGASTIAGEGFGKEMVLGDEDFFSEESYAEKIQNMAQETIVEPKEWELTYFDDPSDMFQDDNLSSINSLVMGDGNGGNTTWDAKYAFKMATAEKLEEEKSTALAKSISGQGFLSEETDGIVAKPGILFKEMKANEENLPNLAVTSATSLGEIIAATVSKAISSAVTKTVSGVERTINREVTSVTRKATREVNKEVNSFGPGALYKK